MPHPGGRIPVRDRHGTQGSHSPGRSGDIWVHHIAFRDSADNRESALHALPGGFRHVYGVEVRPGSADADENADGRPPLQGRRLRTGNLRGEDQEDVWNRSAAVRQLTVDGRHNGPCNGVQGLRLQQEVPSSDHIAWNRSTGWFSLARLGQWLPALCCSHCSAWGRCRWAKRVGAPKAAV